jgi:integrase
LKESIPRKRKHYSREIDYLSTCFGYYHDSLDFNFQSPITKIHKYEFGKMARRSGKKRSNTVKISFDKNQVINLFEKLRLDGSHLPHQFEIIYYYIVAVQFTFGLRLGEACGLEWKDVDFERNILRLTGSMQWYGEDGKIARNEKVNRLKEEGDLDNDEALEYPMPDEMVSIFKTIKALNRSDRWVMANRSGNVPQYSKIYARLMRTGFFDEVGQCSHKLRKTAKTLGQVLVGEKMSIDLMRHSSSAVSDRYTDDSVLAKHNPIPGLLSKMIGN